jgi:hypothetical protein
MKNSENGLLANRDFTLEKYEMLCKAIADSAYANVTFAEYFTTPFVVGKRFLILRHDVDENCRYALDLALKEYKYKLRATYYFRMKGKTYVPATIDAIAECNHEIGYHYETVDKCHGDIPAAIAQFRQELEVFRQRYPIKTACMHGNPLTRFDNKTIWKRSHLSDFDLIGEPYLSLDYGKFFYFSDSGRTWGSDTWKKAKDKVNNQKLIILKNTDDLIDIIKKEELEHICILTHPERWSKNVIDYTKRYIIDMAYLAGKTVIHTVRKNS